MTGVPKRIPVTTGSPDVSPEGSYRRGDVVLVPIDFTDCGGSKGRTAVVVSSEPYDEGPDLLIASITGNISALPHPGDHRIREWKVAGLIKESLAQTKLAAVEVGIVRRKLGKLDAGDLEALDAGLKVALGVEAQAVEHGATSPGDPEKPPEG